MTCEYCIDGIQADGETPCPCQKDDGFFDLTKPINNITNEDVEEFLNTGSLQDYQIAATKTAVYPGQGTALGLTYCALKLNGEAGELAEHVGKAMRDDGLVHAISEDGCTQLSVVSGFFADQLRHKRHELIVKEVGDCLWYLSAICNELGIDLYAAGVKNLQKLQDRQERNKLQGSGDDR